MKKYKINYKIISIGKRAKGMFYCNHLGKCADDLTKTVINLDVNIYQLLSRMQFFNFNYDRYTNYYNKIRVLRQLGN